MGNFDPFGKIVSVPQILIGKNGALVLAAIIAAPSFGSVTRQSGVRVPCKKIPVAQPLLIDLIADLIAARSPAPRLTG